MIPDADVIRTNRMQPWFRRRLVTEFRPVTEAVLTADGEVSFYDWCRRETARIRAKGDGARMLKVGRRCAVQNVPR
jgi:hypothetical protein